MQRGKGSSLHDLVSSFDDLPAMMNKMNASSSSGNDLHKDQRYAVAATTSNRSHPMDEIGTPPVRGQRIANQAKKVIQQLSKIHPVSPPPKRSIVEASNVAENKLRALLKSGIDLNKLYSQYDVNRTGKVSYKDFSDTLVNLSSGIDRQEAQQLASLLDRRKLGGIEYKNILKSLREIQSKEMMIVPTAAGSSGSNNRNQQNQRRRGDDYDDDDRSNNDRYGNHHDDGHHHDDDRRRDHNDINNYNRRENEHIDDRMESNGNYHRSDDNVEYRGGSYSDNYNRKDNDNNNVLDNHQANSSAAEYNNYSSFYSDSKGDTDRPVHHTHKDTSRTSTNSISGRSSPQRSSSPSLLSSSSPGRRRQYAHNATTITPSAADIYSSDVDASTLNYLTTTSTDVIHVDSHVLDPHYKPPHIQASLIMVPTRHMNNPDINRTPLFTDYYHSIYRYPYHIDKTTDEVKRERGRGRSSSAPTRNNHSSLDSFLHSISDGDRIQRRPYKYSLKAKLLQQTSVDDDDDDDGAHRDGDTDSRVTTSTTTLSATANATAIASRRSPTNRRVRRTNPITDPFQTSADNTILDLNPLYKIHAKRNVDNHSYFHHRIDPQILENSMVNQLNGNISVFKHLLQLEDPTKSGVVTKEEFKTALTKTGIHLDRAHMTHLYNSLIDKKKTAAAAVPASIINTTTSVSNTDSKVNSNSNRTVDSLHALSSKAAAYTTDEGISIDDLIANIELRSTVAAFKHVHHNSILNDSLQEDKFGDYLKKQQLAKVTKKVLDSHAKLSNPVQAIHYMDSNKDGLFSREQLQQALLYNGSNLSTSEFNLLYDNLPKTYKDNKVDMNSFHPDLLKHVDRFREHTNMIIDKKKTSLGVSKTFRESDDFIVTNNQASYTEYQPIDHTLDTYYRKGEHNKRFSRLTSILNDNASKVLCAFSSNTTADNSSGSRSSADIALSKYINDVAKSGVMKEKLRDVSIDELQKHLSNAGLVLTESDYLNVKNHLKRSSSASRNSRSSAVDDIGRATIDESKVSLEEFCNAMKIPLMITDKAVVALPRDIPTDYGIFTNSLRTVGASSSFSSSFCIDKPPQTSGKSHRSTPHRDHPIDVSHFWDFPSSSDALFSSPMPSLREPLPKKQDAIQINSQAATQGIVRINQQSAMLSLSDYLHHKSINNSSINNNNSSNNNNKIYGRSSSAPPASRIHYNNTANAVRKSQISFADYTAVHDDSSMINRHQQHLRSTTSKDVGAATSTTPLDANNNAPSTPSTPYIAKLKSATNIARWASSSLAEYFESKGNHHDMSMHDIRSNDRVNDKVNDVNTHNSTSTPTRRASSEIMSSTKKPISSLRRVFINQNNATSAMRQGSAGSLISSQAPFATDS